MCCCGSYIQEGQLLGAPGHNTEGLQDLPSDFPSELPNRYMDQRKYNLNMSFSIKGFLGGLKK